MLCALSACTHRQSGRSSHVALQRTPSRSTAPARGQRLRNLTNSDSSRSTRTHARTNTSIPINQGYYNIHEVLTEQGLYTSCIPMVGLHTSGHGTGSVAHGFTPLHLLNIDVSCQDITMSNSTSNE
jgi:hypothetical protein